MKKFFPFLKGRGNTFNDKKQNNAEGKAVIILKTAICIPKMDEECNEKKRQDLQKEDRE